MLDVFGRKEQINTYLHSATVTDSLYKDNWCPSLGCS